MADYDRSPAAIARRKRVLKRLENQLLTGFKSTKNELGEIISVKLTDEDRRRIEKELEKIKTRI